MNAKHLSNEKILIDIDSSASRTDPAAALKKIEGMMAAQIRKETGAAVEITCCGVNKWSACGTPEAVDTAMGWMAKTGTTVENERIHDDELGETFAYFTTNT